MVRLGRPSSEKIGTEDMGEQNKKQKRSSDDRGRRVAITGVGAITAAGVGAGALFDAAVAGKTAITSLETEAAKAVNVHVAGQVPDFDAVELGLTKKQARRWERFVQFAAIASDEAMRQAGLARPCEQDGEHLPAGRTYRLPDSINDERFAVVFGTGIGGSQIFQDEAVKMGQKGAKRVNPLFIPTMVANIAAGELAIRYGLHGECTTTSLSCTTGTQCIGEAYRLIRHGYADYALAGGSEESLTDIAIAGFSNLGALTHEADPKRASTPFDKNRSGFVVGEGAGALVLETLEGAQARGADIIAEIVGFGATADAYHITSPDPSGIGIMRSMRLALEDAGMEPADIGHINAHGTSTPINDATESRAICALLDVEHCDVPVTSTKAIVGHTLGAAGAVEAVVTALSVSNDLIPPTAGFGEADPDCNVTVLKEAKRGVRQKVALSNSVAFGGHNGTLAIAPIVQAQKS